MHFRKTNKLYKSIIQNFPFAVVVHESGIIIDANSIVFKSFKKNEIFGKKIINYLPKINESNIEEYIYNCISKNKKIKIRTEIRFKNKLIKYDIDSFSINSKKKSLIVSILNPVLNEKRNIKEPKNTSLRNILRKINFPALAIDPIDSKIVTYNNSACAFFESNFEFPNNSLFAELVDCPVEETMNIITSATNSEKNNIFFKHKISEDIIKYSEINFTSLIWNNKKMLLLLIHDISQKLSVEKKALNKTKEFNNLINKIPTGIFKTYTSGNIIDFNSSFHKMFGFDNKQDFEKSFLRKINFTGLISRIISRHLIFNPGKTYAKELKIKTQRGDFIYVSLVLYLTFNNNIPECYGILHDITSQTKNQNLVLDINRKLEKEVEKRTFELNLLNKQLLKEIDIRKKTQLNIIKSRNLFNKLINELPDPLLFFNKKKKITFTNSSFKKTFGENQELILELKNHFFRKMEFSNENEEIINDINGKTKYYLTKSSKIKLEENKTEEVYIGLMRDITEFKNVNNKLLESEIKFRKLVDYSPNGVFICNQLGQIEVCNAPLSKLINLTKDELLNNYVWDIDKKISSTTDINALLFEEEIKKLLNNENSKNTAKNIKFETQIQVSKNKIRYLEVHIFSLKINKHNKLAGIVRDISDKKIQILRIKKTNQKLQTILNNSSGVFLVVNSFLKVTYFNHQAYIFFKKYHTTKIRINLDIFSIFINDDRSDLENAFKSNNRYSCFLKNYSDETKIKWFNYEINTLIENDYSFDKYFINIQDYTTIKHQENNLYKIIKKEKELNEFKTGILSIVSHEFKTPLASINLNSQIILNNLNSLSNTEVQKYFNRVFNSVNLINKLIDDVSFYRKNQEHLTPLCKEYFNIIYLINSTITNLRYDKFLFKKFQIINNLNSDIIFTDQNYLQYIISNLLSNAIKFSRNKIIVKLNNFYKKHITIDIIDDGIGIPKEEIPKVFDAFYRCKNINSAGTGLGMSIVLLSIKALNAAIDIESEINKGTIIKLTIPNLIK